MSSFRVNLSSCVLGFFAALSSTASHGASFSNGSFELGTVNPAASSIRLDVGSQSITGWTVINKKVDYIGTLWQRADGSRSVDLDGSEAGGITQTFDTLAGQQYAVSFFLAGNPDSGPAIKTLQVSAAGISSVYTFDSTGKTRANMGYLPQQFAFTATQAATTLAFTSLTSPQGWGPVIDNVQVSAVPEPATVQLLLAGLVFAVGMRRKNRHAP